jgi:hypothetical protein
MAASGVEAVSNPETELALKCRKEIEKLGIPCTRVNSGGYRGRMLGAIKGTPDTWTALGWIEFKMPGKKLSADQERWHADARRWGVRVAVVTSVEETITLVKAWIRAHEHERTMGW